MALCPPSPHLETRLQLRINKSCQFNDPDSFILRWISRNHRIEQMKESIHTRLLMALDAINHGTEWLDEPLNHLQQLAIAPFKVIERWAKHEKETLSRRMLFNPSKVRVGILQPEDLQFVYYTTSNYQQAVKQMTRPTAYKPANAKLQRNLGRKCAPLRNSTRKFSRFFCRLKIS